MAGLVLEVHIASLERGLAWERLKIQSLTEALRQERIDKYGPKSEPLNDLQLELLDGEPGVTREEIEAESRREPMTPTASRERKPHPGRSRLPETLPRVDEVLACAQENCTSCGGATKVIGYDDSEVLDRDPARWFVRLVKRDKRACPECSRWAMRGWGRRLVAKGLAGDRVRAGQTIRAVRLALRWSGRVAAGRGPI